MGWLTDIFKDVPLSAELREKLATIEAENDALKTDNVILRDDLREAKAEIIRLEKKLDQFAHHSELDETDILILKEIASPESPLPLTLLRRSTSTWGRLSFVWNDSGKSITSVPGVSAALSVIHSNQKVANISLRKT